MCLWVYNDALWRRATAPLIINHGNIWRWNDGWDKEPFTILKLNQRTNLKKSGIYILTWETRNSSYIGQTGSQLKTRFAKHQRYMNSTNHETPYYAVFPAPISSSPQVQRSLWKVFNKFDFFPHKFPLIFSNVVLQYIRFTAQVYSIQTNNTVLTVDCCFDWCGWLGHWRSLQRCEKDLSPRGKMYRCEA